jgi:hypothetical protein
VQLVHGRQLAPAELGTQVAAQQRVVPVAAPGAVVGGHEDTGPLQPVEHLPGVLLLGQLGGQSCGERVADARREHELLDILRLAGDDLTDQVLGDDVVVPREATDEVTGWPRLLEGDRGEAQRGRPALGPLHQQRQLFLGELHTVTGVRETGFRRGEREVVRTDLA